MQLTTEQLKQIIDGTQMQDGETLKTRSYSGRAMYGSKCLGYTVESHNLIASVAWIMVSAADMEVDTYKVAEAFEESRTDNMGRSAMIVYFPKMDVEGINFSSDEDSDEA